MPKTILFSIIGGILIVTLAVFLFVGLKRGVPKREKESLASKKITKIPETLSEETLKDMVSSEPITKFPSDWKTYTSKLFKFSIQYPPEAEVGYPYLSNMRPEEEILRLLNDISIKNFGKKFDLSDSNAIEVLKKSDALRTFVAVRLPSINKGEFPEPVPARVVIDILWDETRPSLKEWIKKFIQEFRGPRTEEELVLSRNWIKINQIEGFEEIYWDWFAGGPWASQGALSYNFYFENKAFPGIYYVANFWVFPSEKLETALNEYKLYKQIVNTLRLTE